MSLDDESHVYKIISICNDNRYEVEFDLQCLALSNIIQEQLRLDPTSRAFEVKDVPEETLRSIQQYLNHHQGKAPEPIVAPLKSKKMSDVTNAFDAAFVDKIYLDGAGDAQFRALGNAALLLNIKPLFELVCAKWASLVIGLPLDQAKQVFAGK